MLDSPVGKHKCQDYMIACEKSLPFIFNIMQSSNGDYTPELYLSLELLSIIIKSCPGGELPAQIFLYAFPILQKYCSTRLIIRYCKVGVKCLMS